MFLEVLCCARCKTCDDAGHSGKDSQCLIIKCLIVSLHEGVVQGSSVVELEQPDPAGNPGLAGVKSAKQTLLFKNITEEATQEGHVKPKWADVYCC
jgi:hypothetical protein